MKKAVSILICAFAILWIFPLTAHADMGPKPSVVVDFSGLEGQHYYATLLSRVKSTGPHTALSGSNQEYMRYQEEDEEYDIFLKFVQYEDADGFYFLQFFQDCSQTQQFKWTYYPPHEFKILLYFPETDRFIVSGQSYESYAFHSYFAAEVSPAPQAAGMTVAKSHDYTDEIFPLLVRILLTIAIELAIALLFGFRQKRQFRFIVLVNIVTQVALNLTLHIINYRSGPLAFVMFYILLELVVFLIEAALYTQHLGSYGTERVPGWKPWVYALVANGASFAAGLALAHWLPGIF